MISYFLWYPSGDTFVMLTHVLTIMVYGWYDFSCVVRSDIKSLALPVRCRLMNHSGILYNPLEQKNFPIIEWYMNSSKSVWHKVYVT